MLTGDMHLPQGKQSFDAVAVLTRDRQFRAKRSALGRGGVEPASVAA
jgi:hypothetical protein